MVPLALRRLALAPRRLPRGAFAPRTTPHGTARVCTRPLSDKISPPPPAGGSPTPVPRGSAAPALSSEPPLDVLWPLRHLRHELPAPLLQAFSRQNMSVPELRQLEVQEAIRRWQRFPGDTGSTEVQVAVLTQKIEATSSHSLRNRKDKAAKRYVSILVSQRARMLKYLRRKDRDMYKKVIEALGIRPSVLFDPTAPPAEKKVSRWFEKILAFKLLNSSEKAKLKQKLPRKLLSNKGKLLKRRERHLKRKWKAKRRHEMKVQAYLARAAEEGDAAAVGKKKKASAAAKK
ncbi:hypothetical protein AB1Y20_021735 [Prymnesium parvum]|uniref:30S ribosomal protein S15 n=1 Tax=Prymnesium parvum TaxID=97485 RepID=A0AB34JME1_PRYPA